MALTKVDKICSICDKELEEGLAVYITKVNLTSNGRTAPESGMAFGGSYKATPQDKLRIQYLGSSKPRVCVHLECYESKIQNVLFPIKKNKKKK